MTVRPAESSQFSYQQESSARSGEFCRLSRRTCLASASAMLAGQPYVRGEAVASVPPRSVIYIFLSGGLAQHESFDPKPDAPADIRGEFSAIATQTPGLQICEHLPQLAARSNLWSVVRSLSHPYNEHSQGHMAMLSGRTPMPVGFNPSMPRPTDHPSIAALMGALLPERNGLPSSIVLPEKLIHRTGPGDSRTVCRTDGTTEGSLDPVRQSFQREVVWCMARIRIPSSARRRTV